MYCDICDITDTTDITDTPIGRPCTNIQYRTNESQPPIKPTLYLVMSSKHPHPEILILSHTDSTESLSLGFKTPVRFFPLLSP